MILFLYNHCQKCICLRVIVIGTVILYDGGPGSVVVIANAYGLDGPGDRIPVEARFSTPVLTGPEAHPASRTMGTGSFPGIRCGQGVTLTPHPFLVPRLKIE